jgi:hypothetical protein
MNCDQACRSGAVAASARWLGPRMPKKPCAAWALDDGPPRAEHRAPMANPTPCDLGDVPRARFGLGAFRPGQREAVATARRGSSGSTRSRWSATPARRRSAPPTSSGRTSPCARRCAVSPAHQRFQQEAGKPEGRRRPALRPLQLLPDSRVAEGHARNAGRAGRLHVDHRRSRLVVGERGRPSGVRRLERDVDSGRATCGPQARVADFRETVAENQLERRSSLQTGQATRQVRGVGDIRSLVRQRAHRTATGCRAGRRTLAQTSPYPGAEPGFALSGLSLPSGAARSG